MMHLFLFLLLNLTHFSFVIDTKSSTSMTSESRYTILHTHAGRGKQGSMGIVRGGVKCGMEVVMRQAMAPLSKGQIQRRRIKVNSFDVVMGFGIVVPYMALAQKAISRHFRCLKDAYQCS